MSKKKFTDGLESLFDETEEQGSILLTTSAASSKESGSGFRGKGSSGKDFSSDLEMFLHEAFEESFEAQLNPDRPAIAAETQIRKRHQKPSGGLDALIRNTIDRQATHIQETPTRRVTLVFDQDQLMKLKSIARIERTFLKEIINSIVSEFIQEYEKEKGKVD